MILNHKSDGEGPSLIILHGLFGMLDNWKTVASRLADHYTVHLLDLRNHGRSPHYPSHTYADMASDISNWMSEQGISSSYVLGHSMGGKAAVQLAYDYPDLVDRLIVVDIAPKTYTGGHEAIISALESVDIDSATSRSVVEEQLGQTIKSRGVILFLMKNLTRKKEGGYAWKMNLPTLAAHYQTHIMSSPIYDTVIDTPTLFIAGGDSDYITDTDREDIAQTFTQVTHRTIDGAGHWVHADKPDILIQEIQDFL